MPTRRVTRNHYLHEYFPHTLAYASCDDEVVRAPNPAGPRRVSQQAPRRVRLATAEAQAEEKSKLGASSGVSSPAAVHLDRLPVAIPSSPVPIYAAPAPTPRQRRPSLSDPAVAKLLRQQPVPFTSTFPSSHAGAAPPALEIKCHVRTRIPTPHGHVFLHLYTNNRDGKEHLAIVADQAQMDAQPGEAGPSSMPFLRSASLDDEWREGETEIERIVRGAYVGRLSADTITPSSPGQSHSRRRSSAAGRAKNGEVDDWEPPLVRIHSECFTGEVIGSQRCDCGEQLDEAFRLITEARRGVIVYLRQEGRGIGLLEKMRAYNLQDIGHDTVAANLLLGHGADLRTYDVAGAILRDLAVPEVRLLTNNPDKIEQIEKEGIVVVERVAMVPRSWTAPARKAGRKARARPVLSGAALLQLASEAMLSSGPGTEEEGEDDDEDDEEDYSTDSDASHNLRRSGVGMIGASTTRSAELDKYLRTKIERMGHLLDMPATPPSTRAGTPQRRHRSKMAPSVAKVSLMSSAASLVTDEGSVDCGSGCGCGERMGESMVEDPEA